MSHPLRRSAALFASLSLAAVTASSMTLPSQAAPMPAHSHPVAHHAYDPTGRTAAQVESDLAAHRVSATRLAADYLARIAAYNHRGPAIRAVIDVNPRALAEAAASDRRRRAGRTLGPLDGVPVLVKDNIDIAGMRTAGGSIALTGNVARVDAPAVARLRAAGAVILAQTNMSELAASYGRLGYSSLGGTTLNPADLRRNASGSSSGSAAGVAASFAPLALGTDTSGSVRGPASSVGLVGLRPTLDAVSAHGVIPVSHHLDVVGAMGRTANDTGQLYATLTGQRVTVTALPLKGRRIGLVQGFDTANADVHASFQSTAALLRQQGATVVPVTLGADGQYAWTPIVGPLSDLDFAKDFDDYLGTTGPRTPKTLAQVIDRLTSPAALHSKFPPNPARVDGLKQSLADASQWGGPTYTAALDARTRLQAEVRSLMDTDRLDALMYPTMECPASPVWGTTDTTYACTSSDEYAPSYVSPATGFPEVTWPASLDRHGLPIGMSLLGRPHAEPLLLDLMATLQRLTHVQARTASVPPLH